MDKNMETNASARRTTSTYKKGKNKDWKVKVAQATDPGGTAQGNNKNQEATSKPTEGTGKTCHKSGRHPTACCSQINWKKKVHPKFLQNLLFHILRDIFLGERTISAIESAT